MCQKWIKGKRHGQYNSYSKDYLQKLTLNLPMRLFKRGQSNMNKKITLSNLLSFSLLFSYISCRDRINISGPAKEIVPTEPVAPAETLVETTSMDVSYLDVNNANNPVPMTESSIFPTTNLDANAGDFNLLNPKCAGRNSFNYVFKITNTGSANLISTATPSVSVAKITDYSNLGYSPTSGYSFTISTLPTFPVLPGASTNTTLTFSNSNNFSCQFGAREGFGTVEKARIEIHTNDANNPNFMLDLNVFGNS